MKKLMLIILCISFGCRGVSQENEIATTKTSDKQSYKVEKTDAQWKAELSDIEYYILRRAGTETPGSSELLNNKDEGTYVCAACGAPLFKSEHKFESGTGWPSFDREIEGQVAFDVDYKIGYKRTEEHCATCGGHLGHVFDDGPRATTGKRHCVNGAALDFIPKSD